MKRVVLLVAALLALSPLSYAKDVKIAKVDVRNIMQNAKAVKVINAKLEKDFGPRREALVKIQKSFQDNQAKLSRDAGVMSAKQKSALTATIKEQQQTLENKGRDFQQALYVERNKSMQDFFAKVKKTVSAVAKAEGIDYVLQGDSIVYAKSENDITSKVLKKLDS